MNFFWGVVVGFFVGGIVGFIGAGFLRISKEADIKLRSALGGKNGENEQKDQG